MKIKQLYRKNEIINLESYLTKCGVKDIEEFLDPTGKYLDNYYDYYNMLDAVEMFSRHIGDETYILCDDDVDGITSTVILARYMKKINPDWSIRILVHEGKERGLQDEVIFDGIKNTKEKYNFNAKFLIIPDGGTNDKIEADSLDIDILVLDHHMITTPITNGILVNNQNERNKNVSTNGSGCLVVHKFLQALDNKYDVNYSAEYIDLVALSLVSDVMDMSDEQNRTYYHYGIETAECINNKFLKVLFNTFIGDKPYTQRDIAFKIVPKLNAVCRSKDINIKYIVINAFLGNNIKDALEICTKAHSNQVNIVNEIIENHIDEITDVSNNNLVVFACDDMPRSYSGLIAGKIMDISGGKPTLVGKIMNDEFVGSLRSPIPLQGDLDNNELVEWARGHEQSCGVLIKQENLQPLVDYYNSLKLSYEPCINVLRSYSIQDIPYNLFDLFGANTDVLWGNNIPKPMFELHDIIFIPNDLQILGKNHRTIKLISNDISFLFFNITNKDRECLCVDNIEKKDTKLNLSIIGTPSINIYTNPYGKTYVNKQVIVDNFKVKKYILKIRENVFK
jgi:single-stranded-DNA-specific exonuclease